MTLQCRTKKKKNYILYILPATQTDALTKRFISSLTVLNCIGYHANTKYVGGSPYQSVIGILLGYHKI